MVHQTFYDSIVLFGDSITQYASDVDERGFGAQLGHVFQRRLDVINRGFSGYTTEQAIHLLPQILPHRGSFTSTKEPKIQFLTIFFGANDACLPGSPQHVPLQTFEKNLRILLDMVHNPSSVTYSPHTRVILIVAPVIDEAKWLIRRQERKMMMDRDETVAKEYATLARKVGLEYTAKGQELNVVQEKEDGLEVENKEWHKVHVIDTYTLMEEAIERNEVTKDQLLKDGLHLGPAGNDLIFTQIMAIIRTHYPQYDPDTMPMHAPWWGDLDRIHPEKDLLIATNRD